ncbi:hypothetical protein R5W24_005127 [Gemmata sp. JC717]|uniref:hypothetical protein n=1 Tax=Gemmata algarum TaxID=2975278 RepID=UPI0021BABC39|nr:hypothetical protein [Gemmata algarum]MDY3555980.1 hypothetical protein [Gemmata algarum]
MSLSLYPVPVRGVHVPGFQVFRDPVRTEPRYWRGLIGVGASLGRIFDALAERDELSVASILADMAACLRWKAADFPGSDPDLSAVAELFDKLRAGVTSSDRGAARRALAHMLRAMGQPFRPTERPLARSSALLKAST